MLQQNTVIAKIILVLGVSIMVFVEDRPLVAAEEKGSARKAATAEGKFGNGLPGSRGGLILAKAKSLPEYYTFPFTVECWAKLNSKNAFNIIVANDPKPSSTHWEIYSYSGSGYFSVYVPGSDPSEIISDVDICDGRWHYLAAVLDEERIRLYVDAKEVVSTAVTRRKNIERQAGTLAFGMLNDASIGCDGVIDEVRLSKGTRRIIGIPKSPFPADGKTVGLWHFNAQESNGDFPDSSRLKNPVHVETLVGTSLDEIDRRGFKPGPSPFDSTPDKVALRAGTFEHPAGPAVVFLDGEWEMAEEGSDAQRLKGEWTDAVPATVPGSVHTALVRAGRIPDPTVGLNHAKARENSFKTWWFKRTFLYPKRSGGERLIFGGVAVDCTVWLNGRKLGDHKGMFGGPAYDVGSLLKAKNTLIVKIDPAPYVESTGQEPGGFFKGMNVGWLYTVVFNNVYGWHYSNIPAIGIWRSVRVESAPAVTIEHPFVSTEDAHKGIIRLAAKLKGERKKWTGTLQGTIEPDNFSGTSEKFSFKVKSNTRERDVHLRFTVPKPKLWWPNDFGEPNLYRMKLSFTPQSGSADYKEVTFGIRTVEMAPLPGGPYRNKYNWTFVINGRPMFVKGTGWCTMDPLMDFSRERYDRVLSLADQQHVQMLRAWGSGMPETDEFYDLCNRKGIMVLQEWPTAWNSHKEGWQPYDILEETVRLNTLRLRNNPCLVMWGAGNESGNPFGRAIDMMGRYSVELDGTRAFHRAEPWGGSRHDYGCWWGKQPLDNNLRLTADFLGEFGIASLPNAESVLRYLPRNERKQWHSSKSFTYHTPVFNKMDDMKRLDQYAYYFVPTNASLEMYAVGSQLSQATGVRHPLELARTRWPQCSGALYYKMNDNYPAASWACVDWYGAPKIGHYIFQDAFMPLHACVIFSTLNPHGREMKVPVFLLDDSDALNGAAWQVVVRAYDAKLGEIRRQSFTGRDSIEKVSNLGSFTLGPDQTRTTPLLIVVEVIKNEALADRTFYWLNYEPVKGCLFSLPATRLAFKAMAGKVTVKNTGKVPAVAVNISRPDHLHTFRVSDNYFWLDPGESRSVEVSDTQGIQVSAWNS